MERPETQYAWNGDSALAYQVVGGSSDLLFIPGIGSNVELNWNHPTMARFPPRACSGAPSHRDGHAGYGMLRALLAARYLAARDGDGGYGRGARCLQVAARGDPCHAAVRVRGEHVRRDISRANQGGSCCTRPPRTGAGPRRRPGSGRTRTSMRTSPTYGSVLALRVRDEQLLWRDPSVADDHAYAEWWRTLNVLSVTPGSRAAMIENTRGRTFAGFSLRSTCRSSCSRPKTTTIRRGRPPRAFSPSGSPERGMSSSRAVICRCGSATRRRCWGRSTRSLPRSGVRRRSSSGFSRPSSSRISSAPPRSSRSSAMRAGVISWRDTMRAYVPSSSAFEGPRSIRLATGSSPPSTGRRAQSDALERSSRRSGRSIEIRAGLHTGELRGYRRQGRWDGCEHRRPHRFGRRDI